MKYVGQESIMVVDSRKQAAFMQLLDLNQDITIVPQARHAQDKTHWEPDIRPPQGGGMKFKGVVKGDVDCEKCCGWEM